MRTYKKLWVDANYSGHGTIWYAKKSDAPNPQFVTPVWILFPDKADLVHALTIVTKLLANGELVRADVPLFGTGLLVSAFDPHPFGRKN
jgi:hypothetical protein